MITTFRDRSRQFNLATGLIAAAVLALAFLLGRRASPLWLGLLAVGIGSVVLLARPALGLPALILAALAVRIEIGTGTDVRLNVAALLIPTLTIVWLLDMTRRPDAYVARSRANLPLLLFLGANLLSLVIGRATWAPLVPVSNNFLLVQLAQWAIFAFSALAFWLTANLAADEKWLRRMTFLFLGVGSAIAIGYQLPGAGGLLSKVTTVAYVRAPFWSLLAALAGGQLLFNHSLRVITKLGLAVALVSAFTYTFIGQQEAVSGWMGLGVSLAILGWLRFPRLRWLALLLVLALIVTGLLIPSVYQFAGGDDEWITSGGSRLILIQRVIDVTMRNPITGLGPAAYRPYAAMKPLLYQRANWIVPQINSHNNYVDLFAHGGVLGLLLFFWFAWRVARLGLALRRRFVTGFAAGYVNAMLAAGASSLAIMLLADWILPFVYNIGFPGFQASVLVWLFMGGLVALENMKGSN